MTYHNLKYMILLTCLNVIYLQADPVNDGKYKSIKLNNNDGKYVPKKSGKYVHMVWPYVHVHDNRELGRYVHIHIPYDGGFGPYSGGHEKYKYMFDNKGDYNLYTVSNTENDPFNIQSYDIPRPDILLEYGFPDHSPQIKKRSILPSLSSSYKNSTIFPLQLLSLIMSTSNNNNNNEENYYSNNNNNFHDHDSLLSSNVISNFPNDYHFYNQMSKTDDENFGEKKIHQNILDDSQTTTKATTTERPRIRYDDEGKWRIIRQEEDKKQKKYDYLYLTENGIYAEEQATLFNDDTMKGEGTSAKGYYEYTGDDGKLYKVVYTVGKQGFVPMGDHIPTVPPAIQRALDYVAAKKRNSEKTR